MISNKPSSLAILLISFLGLINLAITLSVQAGASTEKIQDIVNILETCNNEKQFIQCGVTFNQAVEALEEIESWKPRIGIRIRRQQPLLNCAEWLLRPLVSGGESNSIKAIRKLEENYRLFRDICKRGLVDYFIAHGDDMQNLVKSLFWELESISQPISKELFYLAKKEYNDFMRSYERLNSTQENFDQIEWTLQYLNSRGARTILKQIMPLFDAADNNEISFDILKDIFTDEMRYLGNFVEKGEQHYFNYDVDTIPFDNKTLDKVDPKSRSLSEKLFVVNKFGLVV